MKNARLLFAACLAGMLLGSGCQMKAPPEGGAPAAENPATPGGPGPVVATAFNLADYKGKVVLLDFWATWCAPCRSEIPSLNKIYDDYKTAGNVSVLGMSVDRAEPGQVSASAKSLGIAYPVVLADDVLQQHFGGIRAVPTKFLIDKSGVVRKTFVGVVPTDEIRSEISTLLAE